MANLSQDELTIQTLTAFLASTLTKKYANPSSDIINVLAGLDQVDAIFTEFVATLDVTIKAGRTRTSSKTQIEK
jgi:hypothetical protein